MRTAALFGMVLFPTLMACGASDQGSDSDDLGHQSSAVQGGASTTKRAYNFAVGISSRIGAVCSGTLIAPNLVLTARHCVVPPSGNEGVTCNDTFPTKNVNAGSLAVTTEPRLRGARTLYRVKEITTPKDSGFCGNDIALITLETNIPEEEAQPATPVVQFSMTDRTKIGGQITALGYGNTSPSSRDAGIRRIREKIDILCVPGDDTYECKGAYARMVESDKEFITEGFVCSGDSGGGAFDQDSFTKGTPYVLGTLSRGPQTAERCLAAVYTRTDAHAEMIIEAGKKAAEAGGYEAPEWVSPSVDPSSQDPQTGTVCEGETCTATDATEGAPMLITKTTTTGCSATPRPTSAQGTFGVFALAGLAALVVSRRRRAI